MEKTKRISDYLKEVETTKEYSGYFCSVSEALTIVVLGSICGLRSVSQIHQWASNDRIKEFLKEHFGIGKIPCYYWLLCLLKIVEPTSLNQCFMRWVQELIGESKEKRTISFDGKTVRSTARMDRYDKPLHIISAHIAELGITFAQKTVEDKTNEIPAVRELISLLEIEGCMIVADALHCQKETAKAVVDAKADYLLSVKDNHPVLKSDIEDYVQDDSLRKTMNMASTTEKQSGRIEKRTAYATCDIEWLDSKENWTNLATIGAINTQFETKKGVSNEWHYYISSRPLTAEELLKYARKEWSVETMHWLLDVHFGEDFCRVEDENVQQNLNIVRKIALNSIRAFKNGTNSKRPLSKIMLDCLLDPFCILGVLGGKQN